MEIEYAGEQGSLVQCVRTGEIYSKLYVSQTKRR